MTSVRYRSLLDQAIGKRDRILSDLAQARKDIDKYSERLESIEKAQTFIQMVAKDTQEQLRYHISDIIQLALDTCFPGEYEFDINFEIKRGKTEAELLFRKNGIDIDPMEASGGGVVDLASFALRISAWSLGHSDNTLIFDEPFRFLSKDLQPRAGEIMRKLSKHLKLQFIIVTHSDSMIDNADRVFEVIKSGDVSKVIVRSN